MDTHFRIAAVLAAAQAGSPNGMQLTYADVIDDAREAGVDIEAAYAAADTWTDAELVAVLGGYVTGFDDTSPAYDFAVAVAACNDRGDDLARILEGIGEWYFGD